MNAPPLLTDTEGGAVLTIEVPTSMTTDEPGVNPLPRICTVDPTVPEVGFKSIDGAVRLNVAVAVLPKVSVTTTVFVAVAVTGTAKDVVTAPPAPVVPAADAIGTPLTVTV